MRCFAEGKKFFLILTEFGAVHKYTVYIYRGLFLGHAVILIYFLRKQDDRYIVAVYERLSFARLRAQ